MTDGNEFILEQQRAVERMLEMSRRSKQGDGGDSMPPVPPFVKVQNKEQKKTTPSRPPEKPKASSGGLNDLFDGLPLLGKLKTDKDMTLILGLILILLNDKSDKLLLIALLYILI